MDCSYEKHPFPTFYNNKIKYLIIGSFPPIKLTKKVFCDDNLKQLYEKYLRKNPFIKGNDINFYYGSRENHFWPLFRRLYNKSLSNSEEIKKFLESKNIGITDLFEQCKRKIKNCNIYPSDANLIILRERSLETLFNECSK